MRPLLTLLPLVLGSLAYPQSDFAGRMPEDLVPELRIVLDFALSNSTTVQRLELSKQEANGRRIAAASAVKPTITLTGAARTEREHGDSSFEDRGVYTFLLSQPVYHWGSRKQEKAIGDIEYKIQELASSEALESLVQGLRMSFLDLIVAKKRLGLIRLDLEKEASLFEFQKQQVEAGAASGDTLLTREIALERKQLEFMRSEASFAQSIETMAEQISMDPARLSELVPSHIPKLELAKAGVAFANAGAKAAAIDSHLGLRRAELLTEIERQRLKIEGSALKPKVNAIAGLSSNALDEDGTRREQSFSFVGISVGWRIFDGFKKKGKVLEASSRVAANERSEQVLRSSLESQLKRVERRLDFEARALSIQEKLLENESERLEWIRENTETQKLSESQLEEAERGILRSEADAIAARARYLVAYSEFASALGQDPNFPLAEAGGDIGKTNP